MTETAPIEYDNPPPHYDWDLTVDAQFTRAQDIWSKIRNTAYQGFDWGDSRIPSVSAGSYEEAAAIRRTLGMTDVVKHNGQHTIYYTGTVPASYSDNVHKVFVTISRGDVCEIEYVKEEVTEMVPDPDAPLVEVTKTVTRTVINCAGLGSEADSFGKVAS